MRVLLTGSSGWLGQTLALRLKQRGHEVVGLDVRPRPHTSVAASVCDRVAIHRILADGETTAIVHAAALHKPDIVRFPADEFVSVNVRGTLTLLEAAVAARVSRFVFTSTTSLMISAEISAGLTGGAKRAAWITEEMSRLEPRNIYGVTKLAAEHLCRMVARQHHLPVVVLRTGRFFPEADDMAQYIEQSDANTKANEVLFRRLTAEDAADAHIPALDRAPEIGFGAFIVSAPTPSSPPDSHALLLSPPS